MIIQNYLQKVIYKKAQHLPDTYIRYCLKKPFFFYLRMRSEKNNKCPFKKTPINSSIKGHCHAIWQLYKKLKGVFTSSEFQN